MRSAREIRFRLAQQAENLRLYAFPPRFSGDAKQVGALPLPEPHSIAKAVRGAGAAAQIENLAKETMQHRFNLFGREVATGSSIEWRKDYIHGRTSGTEYFRFIPYLNFAKVGDHKNIWELNRHQHLVLLAQAFLLTGNRSYLTEVETQLVSWFEQNPFLRGINFASALEVAFRALSWLWIDHLAGPELQPDVRRQLWNGMYQHGYFLQANLSTYFSPNTHLLGEGVALHALGLKFPKSGWEQLGHRVVAEERDRQIQGDGSHFEQSTYYHLYALDFFLFYYLLTERPAAFEQPIRKMARYLAAIQGPAALLNFVGDDDGGRLFHPYGDRAAFGRATLATCAQIFPDEPFPDLSADLLAEQSIWWLGAAGSKDVNAPAKVDFAVLFPDSGVAAIARGPLHLLIDTGPFGPGGAGHSHSDTLSFTIRSGEYELLIDPGTYTYVADAEARNDFRGSGYHNTVRVNRKDQADTGGPFRWNNKPRVTRRDFREDGETVYLDAECQSRDIVHRRRYLLVGDEVLFVLDDLTGPEGTHFVEQFWHLGGDAHGRMTMLSGAPVPAEQVDGWRSRCLGSKEEAPVVAFRWDTQFPVTVATAFVFGADANSGRLETLRETNSIRVRIAGGRQADFPHAGAARLITA